MLTCYCGNILVSDGFVWKCPMRGSNLIFISTSNIKDKKYHIGLEIKDKRVNHA